MTSHSLPFLVSIPFVGGGLSLMLGAVDGIPAPIENAPFAGAVAWVVWVFVRYMKERDDSFDRIMERQSNATDKLSEAIDKLRDNP